MDETYRIRPAAADDVSALWAINEAAIPGVNSVSRDAFTRLIELPESRCFVAAPAYRAAAAIASPLGFLLLMAEGAVYDSANYRWFADRRGRSEGRPFAYVDRIAVAETARGQGLGEALYQAAIAAAAQPPGPEVIACEVNLLPPNPGSLRFHRRLGFREVGRAAHTPGEKEVVYLERPLQEPAG